MAHKHVSILEKLGRVTNTLVEDWEDLYGPNSRMRVDYWYRHRRTRAEACANVDRDHLRIAVDGKRVYDGPRS